MPTINKPKTNNYIKHSDCSKAYNYKWRKLRNAYFMSHPLCERCLLDGITKAGSEVHHIKPISTADDDLTRMELLLNPDNLMTLCEDCHHKIHNAMRKEK